MNLIWFSIAGNSECFPALTVWGKLPGEKSTKSEPMANQLQHSVWGRAWHEFSELEGVTLDWISERMGANEQVPMSTLKRHIRQHRRKLEIAAEVPALALNPFGQLCVEGRKEKGAAAPLIPIEDLPR